MVCAQTGSGKTAAFLLPVINKLISSRAGSNAGSAYASPQCVVITPTRELAIQIKDESRKFAMGSTVKSVVTYGGASIQYQLGELVRGCNILIATPSRYRQSRAAFIAVVMSSFFTGSSIWSTEEKSHSSQFNF